MFTTFIKIIFSSILGILKIILIKATKKTKVINLIKKVQPFITQTDLIRIGPKGDGGYLLPDDLVGIEACFLPGIDQISEF